MTGEPSARVEAAHDSDTSTQVLVTPGVSALTSTSTHADARMRAADSAAFTVTPCALHAASKPVVSCSERVTNVTHVYESLAKSRAVSVGFITGKRAYGAVDLAAVKARCRWRAISGDMIPCGAHDSCEK